MRPGLLVGIFLLICSMAAALSPDATREQVFAELGKPTSVARLGEREILLFPKGVRIEMEGGRIVSTKGIVLHDSPDAPAASAAAAKSPALPAAPHPVEPDEDEPVLTEAQKQQLAAEEAAAEKEYAQGQANLMKTVEGMSAEHEHGQQPPTPKAFDFIEFILEMVLKLLLTVAALKLACKYWGVEIFWSGIFKIAAADVAVRGGMTLCGELVLGFPSLFMADEAVAGFVMVLLLKKLSINHAIAQAVTLMFTTKTFSIVVGSFLVTVLLRLLY